MKDITIDAKEQKLGRVASKAAQLLMGKDGVDFAKNQVADVRVNITNASKLSIGEKKLENKKYKRYSGYPGGLKISTMREIVAKKGYSEVMKKAIYGMLPNNKLRPKMMKRLTVVE